MNTEAETMEAPADLSAPVKYEDLALRNAIEIRENSMAGDLVSLLVDEFKAESKPWAQLSEDDQYDLIDRCRKRVETAVTQACRSIGARGQSTIAATLEQVTVKDGIKAVVSLSKADPQRHELVDAQGQTVLLVVSAEREMLTGEMPKPEPTQKRLPIDDDNPVADNCPATAVGA